MTLYGLIYIAASFQCEDYERAYNTSKKLLQIGKVFIDVPLLVQLI